MLSQQFLWLLLVLIIYINLKEVVHGETDDEELSRVKEELAGKLNFTIQTEDGKIRGRLYKGLNNFFYQSFSNIPYARQPTAYDRFQKPSDPLPWEGTLDGSISVNYQELTVRCVQLVRSGGPNRNDSIQGREDCLRLTIIRPADIQDQQERRQGLEEEGVIGLQKNADVLVFFHPGTFMYDINVNPYRIAENLCCSHMLFVFVRFRLGALGFANLGGSTDEIVPNLGLWDQLAALKWVHRNIDYFAGDPRRVTIAGVAAGAASVHYHMLSRHTDGLFWRAITVGGSALCPWALAEESIKKTKTLADALGCKGKTHQEIAHCMIKKDAYHIAYYSTKLYKYQNLPINPLGPVVDYDYIDEHPELLMRRKLVKKVPWLVSFSEDYSLFPNYDYLVDLAKSNMERLWDELAPYILGLENLVDPFIMRRITGEIRKNFFPDFEHTFGEERVLRLSRLVSDRQYTSGIVEAARLHGLTHGNETLTYLYKIRYDNKYSNADFLTIPIAQWDALHPHEFALLTKDTHYATKDERREEPLNPTNETEYEKGMRKTFASLWASFIHSGKPFEDVIQSKGKVERFFLYPTNNKTVSKSKSGKSGILDLGYDSLSVQYAHITDPPHTAYQIIKDDDVGDMRFWRSVPVENYEELDDDDDGDDFNEDWTE